MSVSSEAEAGGHLEALQVSSEAEAGGHLEALQVLRLTVLQQLRLRLSPTQKPRSYTIFLLCLLRVIFPYIFGTSKSVKL